MPFHAQQVLSKIAKFKFAKSLSNKPVAGLKRPTPFTKKSFTKKQLLSFWVPYLAVDTVPPPIFDAVVAVQIVKDPRHVVASEPADATVDGGQDRLEPDVDVAKQRLYISVFEPQVVDLNERNSATSEIVALLDQLEDLDATAQRSVASEVESAIEGGVCLTADVGRTRILNICRDAREECQRLDASETRNKLEKEMQQVVLGSAKWQREVWSQARPSFWDYSDCCNLFLDRTTDFLTVGNLNGFVTKVAKDWEEITPGLFTVMSFPEAVQPEDSWKPRHRVACVCCARLQWSEELQTDFIAGDKCFMQNPKKLAKLLSWERYHERCPLIPM